MSDIKELAEAMRPELTEAMRLPFYIQDGKVIGPDSKCYSANSDPWTRCSLCRLLNKVYGMGHDNGRTKGIIDMIKTIKETA